MKRYRITANGSTSGILLFNPTAQWQVVKQSDRTIWATLEEQNITEYESIDKALDQLALMADLKVDLIGYTRIANKVLEPWKVIDRVGKE